LQKRAFSIIRDDPHHLSDLKGWNHDDRKVYGISCVPANFLISPEGKIIGSYLMGETLNKKLSELLN
jgi:hypothetical protein